MQSREEIAGKFRGKKVKSRKFESTVMCPLRIFVGGLGSTQGDFFTKITFLKGFCRDSERERLLIRNHAIVLNAIGVGDWGPPPPAPVCLFILIHPHVNWKTTGCQDTESETPNFAVYSMKNATCNMPKTSIMHTELSLSKSS